MTIKTGWLVGAGIGALVLAGCSSKSDSGSPAQPAQGGGSSTTTVATRNVTGTGDVLVDAEGRTLYTSEQEMSGKIVCSTDDCTAIWKPLTVDAGQKPTGPSAVSAKLGTVKRPDGASQVSFDGAPLYTFSFDHKAGDVDGEGQKDTFNGTNFVWHAATASGAVAPAPSASSSDTGDGGYGGY